MSQVGSLSLSFMTTSVEQNRSDVDGPTYLVSNTVSSKDIVSIETATNVIASTTREYRRQDYS
ncbi:hypothetical protein E4T47_09011 [Aureobasidium subglaciale]|nr:hypothetical protein E4T43_02705 [Aureobasidium subglaciale]KAI5263598.1 hypothetical protein E4T47_09011 [Aureobasidium subglaciale]